MQSKEKTFIGIFKQGLKHGYGKETEGNKESVVKYDAMQKLKIDRSHLINRENNEDLKKIH